MEKNELLPSRDKPNSTTMVRINPPSRGFSKGTIHGSVVSAVLLFLLFPLVLFGNPAHGSSHATLADILSGLLLGVVGVWVVGGLIEIEGKYRDVAFKAAGGIAIIILTSLIVRPFYNAQHIGKNDIDISILPTETIGKVIEAAQASYIKRGIAMTFNGYDNTIARLRPNRSGDIQYYVRPWIFQDGWKQIFALMDSELPCLTITAKDDGYDFKFDAAKSDINTSKQDGAKILCK